MSQISKRFGKRIPASVVHHIFPRESFPEYQWSDWNLITITNEEHNRLHDRMTGALTEEGIELLKRTARRKGMNERELLDRISGQAGSL